MFTILTLFWETSFICNYTRVREISTTLLQEKQHVWTNHYPLLYILPNKMAEIFYSEYAAYADREYMSRTDDWSRIIESTHAIFCGVISFIALVWKIKNKQDHFLIFLGASMGSQFMNSILYMSNYFIQMKNPHNVNFNTPRFPSGPFLSERPFMWINLFWTIMPMYVIYHSLATTLNFTTITMNKT
tara:strand:+ start:78 stop:638 length:561 start_codon:yes stop_codon:yes gene_type:complete